MGDKAEIHCEFLCRFVKFGIHQHRIKHIKKAALPGLTQIFKAAQYKLYVQIKSTNIQQAAVQLP